MRIGTIDFSACSRSKILAECRSLTWLGHVQYTFAERWHSPTHLLEAHGPPVLAGHLGEHMTPREVISIELASEIGVLPRGSLSASCSPKKIAKTVILVDRWPPPKRSNGATLGGRVHANTIFRSLLALGIVCAVRRHMLSCSKNDHLPLVRRWTNWTSTPSSRPPSRTWVH